MAQPQEGQTATGPNGERAVFRGGQWVVMGGSQMPTNPTFDLQRPQAETDIRRTQVQTQGDAIANQIAGGTAATTVARQNAPEGYMWVDPNNPASGVRKLPGYSPLQQGVSGAIRKDAIQAFSDADALERAADEIEQLYRTGPGATKGIAGVQDYLPTDQNAVFNDAGQQARGYVKRALGFTGGEGNTVAESSAIYDPYLPKAGDRDAQIERKIAALRNLAADSRKKSVTTLGGVPDPNGNIVPVPEGKDPSVWAQTYINGGNGPTAAPSGSTEKNVPINPDYQAEYNQFLSQWEGNPNPDAYVAKRVELDRKYGYQPDEQGYRDWALGAAGAIKQGGSTIPSEIPGVNVPMTGVEQFRNDLVNNPAGAAAAGFGDMVAFGGGSAIMPEQMAMLGDANPYSMAAGQIAGSIAGTSALGRLGANSAGRLAPALLGGGKRAQLARDIGTDAIYSGIYGGVTEGDPTGSAISGAIGSTAGNAVGKVAGAALGGAARSPAAQYLASQKIPMTVGQQLGGMAKGIEDRLAGMPIVGDMVNARRLEGLQEFNRRALGQAGEPIGYTPGNIGKEGVQELFDATSGAYDQATAGANVPLDGQFLDDLSAVSQQARGLAPDYKEKFGLALQNRLGPIADAGGMTGDSYQQAMRGLKGYKAETSKPGFEQEYRDSLGGVMDALTGQMRRGGGSQVVEGLDNANAAYRNAKVLDDAVTRASGGSGSGENFVFTPSQLQRAGQKAAKKYPGAQPFEELADMGQSVLPSKVPDSGTAGRLATIAMGGGLTGAGVGAGALAGGGEGAQAGGLSGLGLAALLAAGGTRGGQKALGTALFGRPDASKKAAEFILRNRGLFGSAAVPLAITSQ